MKPVNCQIKHSPENGTYGDCLRACVASILELDSNDVPHFLHDNCNTETMIERMKEFLKPRSLKPFWLFFDGESVEMQDVLNHMAKINSGIYYMLYGATESGDHVVIAHNDKIVHNPSWINAPFVKCNSNGFWSVMVFVYATNNT